MNCEELITYLSDYIDQDLSEALQVEAQEHLATCQNCQMVLDSTQKMIFLCRETERQAIPAGGARRFSSAYKEPWAGSMRVRAHKKGIP